MMAMSSSFTGLCPIFFKKRLSACSSIYRKFNESIALKALRMLNFQNFSRSYLSYSSFNWKSISCAKRMPISLSTKWSSLSKCSVRLDGLCVQAALRYVSPQGSITDMKLIKVSHHMNLLLIVKPRVLMLIWSRVEILHDVVALCFQQVVVMVFTQVALNLLAANPAFIISINPTESCVWFKGQECCQRLSLFLYPLLLLSHSYQQVSQSRSDH